VDDDTAVEYTRTVIQDRAAGKSARQVEAALGEALVWERQAGRQAAEGDGETALHAALQAREWERIAGLVRERRWPAYDLGRDEQAQAWRSERAARVAADLERAERFRRERLKRAQEADLHLVLPGPVGGRLQALALELGVTAERVVAVLAEHAEASGPGLVQVPTVPVAWPKEESWD
jgi:hypothetical protein